MDQQCQTQSNINITHLNVVRTLGEGSFGEVKLLVDKNDANIAVAVKIVDLNKHKSQANNVRREALLQKYLKHHINVLKFISMRVNTDNQFQLFLEYADGGELFDRIEPDYGMPHEKAKFYFAQLISGLEYIHSKGIVHRDIKPENLLLTKTDILKISDFGMATIFRHEDRERFLDTKCGTWPYVAPEVLSGKYCGPPIDIWSAGVVLVTMLVGELPWEVPNNDDQRFFSWVKGKSYNLSPWNRISTLPLSLLKVVLDPNPEKRASVERIMNNPWFTEDHELKLANDVHMAKRYKACGHGVITLAPYSQPPEMVSLRNNYVPNNSQVDEIIFDSNIENNCLPSVCFSQPDNIDSMLLTKSQTDPTQTIQIHPIQKLAKRMTRFCVLVSVKEAANAIEKVCRSNAFYIKKPILQQIFASLNKFGNCHLAFVVTIFEMNECGRRKILADFRRSKGDGIEFKRYFLKIKNELKSIISKDSYDWLLSQGLICSNEMNALAISSTPNNFSSINNN